MGLEDVDDDISCCSQNRPGRAYLGPKRNHSPNIPYAKGRSGSMNSSAIMQVHAVMVYFSS